MLNKLSQFVVALERSSQAALFRSIQELDLMGVTRALDRGLVPRDPDPQGNTPMCAALLAERDVPLHARAQIEALQLDSTGTSQALSAWKDERCRRILEKLLTAHPEGLNERSIDGTTPLTLATRMQRWGLVRWLVDQGARCTMDTSPMMFESLARAQELGLLTHLVEALGQESLVVRLDPLLASLTPLLQAGPQNAPDEPVVATWRPLLDAWDRLGFPLDEALPGMGSHGSTLAVLAWLGKPRAIEVLLHHGRDPNDGGPLRPDGQRPLTPLHLAVGSENLACVLALLHHGADAGLRAGPLQETTLAYAQRLGKTRALGPLEALELHAAVTRDGSAVEASPARPRL